MWGNAPHAREKRCNLISCLSPFFTLKPEESLPRGPWLSPPPVKAFPSVCGGWESSISDDSVWPLSAAGRRQHLCTRHRQCAIPFSPVPWEPFKWREWEQCCVCSSLAALSKACLSPLWTCPGYDMGFDKLLAWEQLGLVLSSLVVWQDSARG